MKLGVWLPAVIAFALLAPADWIAVAGGHRRVRRFSKIGAIAALTVVAATLHPRQEAERWLFVGALVLGGIGDWFLLDYARGLAKGLASFLAGHLLYVAGFWSAGVNPTVSLIAAVVVATYAAMIGAILIRALLKAGKTMLAAAVIAYFVGIGAMAASAAGSGSLIAAAGSVLFVFSDSLIGWDNFVRPLRRAQLPIIVSYHLAQLLLVLSLL
jgi:uncharacterized membrane protein YhhN